MWLVVVLNPLYFLFLCASAPLVRQDKPDLSSNLKRGCHVNC